MSGGLGRVYLVGAGCGPAEWITLRGYRLLGECGAVVYDDLIDPELLEAAPRQAIRLYMGKREGRPGPSQEEINRTLIDLARAGHAVVRLKGGDPFVFGRGGEEAQALQRAGIPFDVVPGVSSAVAIPGQAGIPVTHRGLSRSFHVVTARTADGSVDRIRQLAGAEGTLVVLMGLSRLEKIADSLLAGGRGPDTPAAVISGGCAPRPMAVRAPLSQIARAARQAGAAPPRGHCGGGDRRSGPDLSGGQAAGGGPGGPDRDPGPPGAAARPAAGAGSQSLFPDDRPAPSAACGL